MNTSGDKCPPAVEFDSDTTRAKKTRRRWLWWLANAMIVAGVLAVPLYFLGSCGYTWLEQRGLRQELVQQAPYLTADVASLMGQNAERGNSGPGSETTGAPGSQSSQTSSSTESTANGAEAGGSSDWETALEAQKLAELAKFREAAEAYDRSVKAGQAIGRLVIPAIDLDVVIIEGTSKSELKEGPGHWPETPFPGSGGNFVVSGHRTTYGAPFLHLDDLKRGDDIYVVLPYALVHYQVTDVFVVYPDQVETVAQRGKEQISLAACHPLHSARQRIVAQGDMVGFVLLK